MKDHNQTLSPATALKFLKWFCPAHMREEIEGDLIQKFHRDMKVMGERHARLRAIWNSIRFFRPEIVLRNKAALSGLRLNINPFASQMNFNKTNTIIGWLVFAIAFLTYFLTVEETASFWDCSEFIATSYKLEVPHPPGAPLFLIIGRLFSFLAMGDVTKVAYAINMVSVCSSAFTILFLYWSIVMFGLKLMSAKNASNLPEEKKWVLLSAGVAGALAYAFSDSFWFSAVEAEVYAMSSLFTAFVFWAILKWDTTEDRSHANRWLILIAYVTGLSIGVHLLNLLTIPALALIYYFKTFKTSGWGIILTLAMSGASILFINDFIVPGLPTLAGYFELFFVNTLGLFFGSGAIVFILVLTALLIVGIWYTQIKKYAVANTFTLAFTFILIGYGSYATIVIRSDFDPPINENAPKDVMSFVRYLKREQYGSRPLLFGAYFTADPVAMKYTATTYVKGKEKYEAGDRKYELEYLPQDETILPRAWYPEDKDDYERIMGLKKGQRPTFAQNISYMFRHQIGTMYMRYFMWNFAGRVSDEQGADWLRPSQWFKQLPASLASNKARNNYFMIPFLLGLIGMFYHFMKDTKNFSVIMLLFFMLGAAIVLYLNSRPAEPRERDYIYVGSYYAFAFWIGLSVIALANALGYMIKNKKAVMVIASSLAMIAPALMVAQGWNDHDRSNRFFSTDSAMNFLNSCDTNGVVFTGGDNDTFPLWYAQETEGCRNDVRVLVVSYSNAEWYIDQTTRQAYTSPPLKYTLSPQNYRQSGPNNIIYYADLNIKSIDVKEYLNLIAKEYPSLRNGDRTILPSKLLTLNIDKKKLLAKNIIPKGMQDLIVDQMQFKVIGDHLEKADLLFLDLLVTGNWERPVYLNTTSIAQIHFDVKPYAIQEGNVYRILPVKNPRADREYLVDTEKTYDRMINKFNYRGLDDPSIYYTDDYKLQQVMNHRRNLNSLAEALVDKGEVEKASKVLTFSLEKMTDAAIPYDPSVADTVSLLFRTGQKKKAIEIASLVGKRAHEVAAYLVAEHNGVSFELRKNMFLLGSMQRSLYENNEDALAAEFEKDYTRLMTEIKGE